MSLNSWDWVFGEVERRRRAAGVVTYRARYAMPDGPRHSRTFTTKMDTEAWLAAERTLVDREERIPQRRGRLLRSNAGARPPKTPSPDSLSVLGRSGAAANTIRIYRQLLDTRILPYFEEVPLIDVSLSEIKQCEPRSTRMPKPPTPRPTAC